jgi:hypothetical protein
VSAPFRSVCQLLAALAFGLVPRPAHAEPRKLGFAVEAWAGEQQAPLTELNDAIARDGFSPLPSVRRVGGVDLGAVYSRVRVGITLSAGRASTHDPDTGVELVTWLSMVGLTAGYDVIHYRTFSAFVATGILAGRLGLDASTEGLTVFPYNRAPDGRAQVSWGYSALPIELGTDQLVPLGKASENETWVLIFGVRAGWVQQLAGGWAVDTAYSPYDKGVGGPDLDLSGLRGRLVLGFGAALL